MYEEKNDQEEVNLAEGQEGEETENKEPRMKEAMLWASDEVTEWKEKEKQQTLICRQRGCGWSVKINKRFAWLCLHGEVSASG